jgi:glycosyltransferase involved in cell wall biosynthesis
VNARERFGVAPDETFVVFVGRLHPGKQPLAVVDAAARAAKTKRTHLKFALIGDGELRDAVTAAINQQGVGDICKLYPWMEPLHAYFAADLVVMPSLFEGFGLVAAEAIATGCPVLRSRTGGTADGSRRHLWLRVRDRSQEIRGALVSDNSRTRKACRYACERA